MGSLQREETILAENMTIDTNVVIAYLSGDDIIKEALTRWQEQGIPLFLPAVVEAEILSFSGWSQSEKHKVQRFLENNFTFIALDRNIARMAAEIRAELKIKLPDAAIAATALYCNVPLITRNTRDFAKIPNLKIIQPQLIKKFEGESAIHP